MPKKARKPSLKDEVVESTYRKCVKERGKEDIYCTGLYAQAKAEMLSTEEYLDKMDEHMKKGGRRRAKRSKRPLPGPRGRPMKKTILIKIVQAASR
jgi:hypothetical protein